MHKPKLLLMPLAKTSLPKLLLMPSTLAIGLAACQPPQPLPAATIVLPPECTCIATTVPSLRANSPLARYAREYQTLAPKIAARVTDDDATLTVITSVKNADLAARRALNVLALEPKPQPETVAQAKQAIDTLRSVLSNVPAH
jgi:hypothetical protein